MTDHIRIVLDPAVLAGKPVVRGTRLSVEFVVGLLADGWSEAEILENYPNLQRDDIRACLACSSSHFGDRIGFAKIFLVFWVEFRFYDSVGFLNNLIECVGRTCAGLADKRRGKNSQFSMRDIGLAAFSPFFMQCPSFLSHQRQMSEGMGHGRSNCQTLLGMERIPSDNHIRAKLDDVEPSSLYGLFDDALAAVETAGALPSLTSLDGHTLIALDGTQYFCSNKLSCPNCSTRKHANGQIDYFHTVVAASIVKPGKTWVLPLRPEFVEPQQGYVKQDCESRAARRWLELNASRYSKLNPVYLGDDIYSKQPVCEEVLAAGAHFLFVCKSDSHKTIGEYLTGVEVPSRSRKIKRGKKYFTYTWRWMLGLPIRDGKDALDVNWLEITIRDSNGKTTYRNSFITDLPVDVDNVEDLAAAGRARWKIENETFNTLKTKGYNLEHNFGHGKNNLSAVLVTLNLIAFAIHLAAELADTAWKAAIEVAGSRVRFFNNLRALTAYILFPSWDSLLKTLAFQVAPPLPT